jgi:hypothetical protein
MTEICTNCGARVAKAIERKTWKLTTVGILAIVAGAVGVIEWIAVVALGTLTWGLLTMAGLPGLGRIVAAVAAIVITVGIVAIVGGIFALRRRRWGLALAGSICAILSFFLIPPLLNVPLAIAAIVLVIMGKSEFE